MNSTDLSFVDPIHNQRAAWLEWRRNGIGASDVAGILGISPWESPYSIWATKVGVTPDDDATEAMEIGLALEPAINTMFHRRTGLFVAGEQTWCTHATETWARATLDGFVHEGPVFDLDAALGGLEAKSTSDSVKHWESNGIPVHYAAQVQFQMWVTGMPRTWVAVFHASFGMRFAVYEVQRDEDDIALIAKECERFWFDHVVTGVAPTTDGHQATTRALKHLAASIGDTIVLDDDTAAAVSELRYLKADAKATEALIAGHENRLKAAMGDCTEAAYDGRLVATWRPQVSNRIDPKALRARLPRVAKRFTKTTSSRTLLVKNTKES